MNKQKKKKKKKVFSFDGDQGVFNDYYDGNFYKLPITYNFFESFYPTANDLAITFDFWNENRVNIVHYTQKKPWVSTFQKENSSKMFNDAYYSIDSSIRDLVKPMSLKDLKDSWKNRKIKIQ